MAKVEIVERREYEITSQQLAVIVGRAFQVDTRGAWLELVCDEICDSCGEPQELMAMGHAVRLHLPASKRTVEVGQ